MHEKPLLLVDIDGVISLFGFAATDRPVGTLLNVDGIPHLISQETAGHLLALAQDFQLAWCSGWEEKANEHLVAHLGLAEALPFLSFDDSPRDGSHWKLAAIDAHAGSQRPLAWIDDAHTEACRSWAQRRAGPTLLVTTDPARGLTSAQAGALRAWAADL